MLIEAVAAGFVGVALLWLVLQPVLFPGPLVAAAIEPLDPEETPRGQALLALKEIEFDRATGKLSDDDFALLNARYSAAAVAALDPPAHRSPHCLVHGDRSEPDARFCAQCGAGLVMADGSCAACHHALPPDASFCPGCGVVVRART